MNPDLLKKWYIDVIFTDVMDDGGDYWKKIFLEKTSWCADDVAGIIFAITGEPGSIEYDDQGRVSGGNVVPVSQLPYPWVFWDCILSALVLFHPEVFPTPQHLVKSLYATVARWKYQFPEQYLNMDGNHVEMLDKILDEREKLHFLEKPLTNTVMMECRKIPRRKEYKEIPEKPKTDSIREMARYMAIKREIQAELLTFEAMITRVVERFAIKWEEKVGPLVYPTNV